MLETVLSGVFVFVLGQIIVKLFIEPVSKLKQTLAAVANAYLLNAGVFVSPITSTDEAKRAAINSFRELSGQIYAESHLVPFYRVTRRAFGLPDWEALHQGAQNLIAIGNWLNSGNTATVEHCISNWQQAADRLGLYIAPSDRIDDELLKKAIDHALNRSST